MIFDDLIKNNKSGLFLYGENEYLKNYYFNSIIKSYKNLNSNVEICKIKSDNFNFDFFSEQINSFGFFSKIKLISIQNFEISKLNQNEKEDFIKILNVKNKDIFYLISFKKGENLSTFFKKINSNITIKELKLSSKLEIEKFIKKICNKNNCDISKENIKYIIENLNPDMFLIQNELNKLCSYKMGKTIELIDIKKLLTKSVEKSAFLITDYILKNQRKKALEILEELLNKGEDEIFILSCISLVFIDIYRVLQAQNLNENTKFLQDIFSYKNNDYRLKKALSYSSKFKEKNIINIIKKLTEADLKMKTSLFNKKVCLQICVIYISNEIKKL